MISELMQDDLPAPVAPAMSRWGIVARFISTGLAVDVAAHGHLERVGGPAGLLGGEDVAQGDDLAPAVGHLHADGLPARDGGQDAHVGGGHGVGDVLVEAGDPGHLHARAQLELVAGDGGADHHADQPGLHAVLGQGVLEGAAGLLDRGRSTSCVLLRWRRLAGGSFHGEPLTAGPSSISSCSVCLLLGLGHHHFDPATTRRRRRSGWQSPSAPAPPADHRRRVSSPERARPTPGPGPGRRPSGRRRNRVGSRWPTTAARANTHRAVGRHAGSACG